MRKTWQERTAPKVTEVKSKWKCSFTSKNKIINNLQRVKQIKPKFIIWKKKKVENTANRNMLDKNQSQALWKQNFSSHLFGLYWINYYFCNRSHTYADAQGWKQRDGNLYIEKALLDALCLTHRNLAVPKTVVKHQSNNDAHWICSIRQMNCWQPQLAPLQSKSFIYISAWASALLVSTTGRCQSLYAWDEWQERFPRFFMCSH